MTKIKFKEVTGKEYGPPPKEKKKTDAAQQSGNQEASEKNKEKKAKKAAEKAAREAEKARNRAEREAREKAKREKLAGVGQDSFGDAPMIQSKTITDKKWIKVDHLKPGLAGQKVLVRGFLQTTRDKGKGAFIVLRSTMYTVQGVCFQDPDNGIPPEMIKYIVGLPIESIVDVEGVVSVPDQPIESCTQKMVEIQITKFHCITKAKQAMPFLLEDAMRPDEVKESDVGAYDEDADEAPRADGGATVGLKNRLDNRWIDLRTPAILSMRKMP